MADDDLRRLDRTAAQGGQADRERLQRERCRSGQCCAHALPMQSNRLAAGPVSVEQFARAVEIQFGLQGGGAPA